MPRSALLVLTALALLAATPPLSAQDSASDTLPRLDPRVDAVVSGGAWAEGPAHGRFRVVVLSEGWEHVRRRAFVEWIAEVAAPDEAERIVATRELTPLAEAFGLADPRLELVRQQWQVSLRAATAPDVPYATRVQFLLGAPGTVCLVLAR